MSRWEPNARERLEKAALELFRERGFDETTVAEIAARAGLTERTFFRYYTDKREVLFGGSGELQQFLVDTLASAPASKPPIGAVAAAVEAVAVALEQRRSRAYARERHALVASHAELRERELIKLASFASAMTEALRRRGVADPAASLAAEAGIAVFKVAFERWIHDTKRIDFSQHVRDSFGQLKAVTAGRVIPGSPRRRSSGKARGQADS